MGQSDGVERALCQGDRGDFLMVNSWVVSPTLRVIKVGTWLWRWVLVVDDMEQASSDQTFLYREACITHAQLLLSESVIRELVIQDCSEDGDSWMKKNRETEDA